MTHYKKNTFEEIKNFLENFSINISTNIKSDEIFFGINSITKASVKNITFYNDYKYLLQLKREKSIFCGQGIMLLQNSNHSIKKIANLFI